jgi:hypothetical protein
MGVAITDKIRIQANCRNFLCISAFLSALDLGDVFGRLEKDALTPERVVFSA